MFLSFGAFTKATVSGSAASIVLPGTSGRYLITVNTDCYLRFDGDTATVSAYDVFLPSGGMVLVQPASGLAASVIQDSSGGTISIHEVR